MSDDLEEKLKRAIAGAGTPNLPKRFYKEVQLGGKAPSLSILLDKRPIKTPMKSALAVPSAALAEAVAGEWRAQDERIDPATMPLTRLCNTAIDRVGRDPSMIVDEIAGFAGSDLVCYRAADPEGLVARQQAAWDPLLDFAAGALGCRFAAVSGIMHHVQPEAALAAITRYLTDLDAFTLTAIHNMTTLTGSCIIAVAVNERRLSSDEAWSVAHVDEDWQIEHWGQDDEGIKRRAGNRREFVGALQLLELLRKE